MNEIAIEEKALEPELGPSQIPPYCPVCKKRQKTYVLVIPYSGARTKNKMGVCQNKDCWRWVDISQAPSWVPDRMVE